MSASQDVSKNNVIWQLKDIGGYLRLLNTAPAPVLFFHRLAVAPFHTWFKEIAEQNNLGMRKARPGGRTKNLFEEAARIFKRISLEDAPSFGSNIYSKDTLQHINAQITEKLVKSDNPFLVKLVSGEEQRDTNPSKVLAQLRLLDSDKSNNQLRLPTLEIGEQILNPSLSIAEKKFMLALAIAKSQAALYVSSVDRNDPSVKFLWKIALLGGAGRDKDSPEDKILAKQEVVANLLIAREMWRLSKHWNIRLLGILNCPVGVKGLRKLPQFFSSAMGIVQDLDFLPVFESEKIINVRLNSSKSKKGISKFTNWESELINKIWNVAIAKSEVLVNRERTVSDYPVSFREATSQAHWLAKKGYSASAVIAALMSALDDSQKEKLHLVIDFKDSKPQLVRTYLEAIHLDKTKRKLAADTEYPLYIPQSLQEFKHTPLLQNEIDRVVQIYASAGQNILEKITSPGGENFSFSNFKLNFKPKNLSNAWIRYSADLEGLVTAHFLEALRPEYDGPSYQKVSSVSQYIRLSYAHFLERIGRGRSSNKLRHEVQRHYPDDYDMLTNFMRDERGLSISQTQDIFNAIKKDIYEIADKVGVSIEVGFREKEYGSAADKVMRFLISFLSEPERFSDLNRSKHSNFASYFLSKQLDLLGMRVIFKNSEDLQKLAPDLLEYFDDWNKGWDENVEINTVKDPARTGIQLIRHNFKIPDKFLPERNSSIPITGEIRYETEKFANEEKVGRALVKYWLAHWQMKLKELFLVDFLRKCVAATRHRFLSLFNLDDVAPTALRIINERREEIKNFEPTFAHRDPIGFKDSEDFFRRLADDGKIISKPRLVNENGKYYFLPGNPEEILVSVINKDGKRNVVRMNRDSYVREVPFQLPDDGVCEIVDLRDLNRTIDWKSTIRPGDIFRLGTLSKDYYQIDYFGNNPQTMPGILYQLKLHDHKLKDPNYQALLLTILGDSIPAQFLNDQSYSKIFQEWTARVFVIYAKWVNSNILDLNTFISNQDIELIGQSKALAKIKSELKEFKHKRFVKIVQNLQVESDNEFTLNLLFDEKQSGLSMKILSLIDEESERLNLDYDIIDYGIPTNEDSSEETRLGEGIQFSLICDKDLIEAVQFRIASLLLPRNNDIPNANPRVRNIKFNMEFDGLALLRVVSALYKNKQYINKIKLPTEESPQLELEIWGEDIGIDYHVLSIERMSDLMRRKMVDRDFEVKESIIRDIMCLSDTLPGRNFTHEEISSLIINPV